MDKLTYSAMSLFNNCQQAYKYRYIDGIVSKTKSEALYFGSIIHEVLDVWYRRRVDEIARREHIVKERLSELYANRTGDETQMKQYLLACAIMSGYARHYAEEDFEIISIETLFERDLFNPRTGRKSRTYCLAGKADAVVERGGVFWLMEHKTTSRIDGAYLDRLWGDFQITLYLSQLEKIFGVLFGGVIYNIIEKSKIRQRVNETTEEFRLRLEEVYGANDKFCRQEIIISDDKKKEVEQLVWDTTQHILFAQKNGYIKNPGYCYKWSSPCQYYKICSSGGNTNIIENYYEKEETNIELKEVT